MCSKHPKYKVVYPPKVDCDACWKMYEKKFGKVKTILSYLKFINKGLTKK